jgi:hypothetical protein
LQHGDNATCDEMKVKAEEGNFVLDTMPSVDRVWMKWTFWQNITTTIVGVNFFLNIVTWLRSFLWRLWDILVLVTILWTLIKATTLHAVFML